MVDNSSSEQNIDYYIVNLFEKLESLKNESKTPCRNSKIPIKTEIRSLEFYRSVISECLASFIYVFILCGASTGAGAEVVPSIPIVIISTALAAGFAIASLTQCFGHISGAHINPAVTIAMGITKNISFLRTSMYVVAQCGGAIAGAAFLCGVTVTRTHQDVTNLNSLQIKEASWEKFGIECILTFFIVFCYFMTTSSPYNISSGRSALTIGATYSACSFICPMPHLNPARSLGPSFVFSNWDNHWVYWVGPVIGGIAAGLVYEYCYNPKRRHRRQGSTTDGEASSMHSDEDTYDDLDKPAPKYHGSTYNCYTRNGAAAGASTTAGYCASLTSASLYSAPTSKLERVESLYGGTKSLYCKSPPLTRANLNRSQSVYTKSNSAVNRDILPKPGPLVPAQSLYPIKLNQQSYVQNQNLQNQLQQRSESIYGVRGFTPGNTSYNTTERTNYTNKTTTTTDDQANAKPNKRPESMYGIVSQRRGQSAQSDDSSYGSYHGPRNNTSYHQNKPTYANRNTASATTNNDGRPPPPPPPSNQLLSLTGTCTPSYHSPNSQY